TLRRTFEGVAQGSTSLARSRPSSASQQTQPADPGANSEQAASETAGRRRFSLRNTPVLFRHLPWCKRTDTGANILLERSQRRIVRLCRSDKVQTKEDEVPISACRRRSAKRSLKFKRLHRCILSNLIDRSGSW